MAYLDDDALVLDHHPYRDRHLLLVVLTENHGVQRGILRRARGGKAPPAAAAQILSQVRVSLTHRPSAELATFQSVESRQSSFPLAADFGRSAAGAVIAELLTTFCPPSEPATRAYRLGVACLHALLMDTSPAAVVTYGEYWMLSLAGVMPPAETLCDVLCRDDLEYLAWCRSRSPSRIKGSVPSGLRTWLDRRICEEADRPLQALSFFRQHAREVRS